MINQEMVLVLGAGASKPYGFPVGSGLRTKILDRVPEENILRWLAGDVMNPQAVVERFQREFLESRVRSIDAFLQHRANWMSIGKRMIVWRLGPCENLGNLLSPADGGDWMAELFDVMDQDATVETFANNRLTVVTFNYDRSFELAMLLHIKSKFGVTSEEAKKVARQIPVLHVYGSLGALAYDGNSSGREYGDQYTIYDAAGGLQLLHEGGAGEAMLSDVQQAIRSANQVVFLGFGFHRENVRRLIGGGMKKGAQWIASCTGMTHDETRRAQTFIGSRTGSGIELVDSVRFGDPSHDALQFLREHVMFFLR